MTKIIAKITRPCRVKPSLPTLVEKAKSYFVLSVLLFLLYRTTRSKKTTICCPTRTSTPNVLRPGSLTPGASNNAAATGHVNLSVNSDYKDRFIFHVLFEKGPF